MFKNPMFSVVISCYNSGKYIGYLLDTLLHQGIRKDEYEIIISDDCSTEDYFDIIDSYRSKLDIRTVRADHNWGYPAYTRDQGLKLVRGDWVIFADHDDGFFKDGLKRLKSYIKKNNPTHLIKTTLMVGDFETREVKSVFNTSNMTHGVVFNRAELVVRYNIHYNYKKFTMEEDTEIMTYVLALAENDYIKINYADDIQLYCWFAYNNKNSISNKYTINNRTTAERTFSHYIKIKANVYYSMMNMNLILVDQYVDYLIKILIRSYVCFNMYRFNNKVCNLDNSYDEENLITVAALLKEIYETKRYNTDTINEETLPKYLYTNDTMKYYTSCIKDLANINSDKSIMFYFSQTIEEFIKEASSYFDEVKSSKEVLRLG